MNREEAELKRIRDEVGESTIDALEGSYRKWQEKKSDGNRRRYLTWRLRLRLRFNHKKEMLEKLNQHTDIGILDEEVGPLYDNVEREIY